MVQPKQRLADGRNDGLLNTETLSKRFDQPLFLQSVVRHIRRDIEAHFREFKRSKAHWGMLEDVYNFDETSCMIGIQPGFFVIVPINCTVTYIDDRIIRSSST
jgi:hypothetical protein